MKLFISLFLLITITAANAQTVKNGLVVMGKTDSVKSKILGEKRQVWIYLPNGAGNADSKKRYPVVYLLDGDGHFASVAGMVQQLSEVNGNTICPEMIVVAIPNTDRTRDLTPTNSLLDPSGKKVDMFKTSGGGEKFTSFIEKELIPHIDSVYPTAPYKVLIGHSFGGLTVMNIVINHTNLFNDYVAIDPSMWWDSKKLLMQAHEVMKQKKFEGKALYLGIANTMPGGMDTLQVRRDTSGGTAHIRSILELKDVLQDNAPANGLQFAYSYHKDDSHGSVPLIAEYNALRFLFAFNKLSNDDQYKIYDDPKADIVSIYDTHYAEVSKHFGYKVLPSEDEINQMGYYFLRDHQPNKAYTMFALNIKNYPESFNVFDSMGDYYADQENKAKAIEYFQKALKLKENPDTRGKLDKLKSGK